MYGRCRLQILVRRVWWVLRGRTWAHMTIDGGPGSWPEEFPFDPDGGGEESARFIISEPLGVPPLPHGQWPHRSELGHMAHML